MNLEEFIKQNPACESEVIAYAKPKIAAEFSKAENSRVAEILALAGVKLSDDVKAAIENGKSPEAFAKEALSQMQAARTENGQELGSPKAETEVSKTLPPVEKKENGAVTDEEKVRALAKRM